jgi:hypothetical protein
MYIKFGGPCKKLRAADCIVQGLQLGGSRIMSLVSNIVQVEDFSQIQDPGIKVWGTNLVQIGPSLNHWSPSSLCSNGCASYGKSKPATVTIEKKFMKFPKKMKSQFRLTPGEHFLKCGTKCSFP